MLSTIGSFTVKELQSSQILKAAPKGISEAFSAMLVVEHCLDFNRLNLDGSNLDEFMSNFRSVLSNQISAIGETGFVNPRSAMIAALNITRMRIEAVLGTSCYMKKLGANSESFIYQGTEEILEAILDEQAQNWMDDHYRYLCGVISQIIDKVNALEGVAKDQ